MSGIAGIIHFDGAPVEPGLVEGMTSAMSHRGPDGIRHWIKGSVALGQCMLCTTPESLEEQQPLTNEDESLVLVMDGRVDNWEELRRELLARDAVLRNRTDAELVLRSYEQWGRECLAHVDGDFALVIWDVRQRTAFCARDRIGNKPLNYHWNGRTLAFSSELHAILSLPWVKRELNEGTLAEFLADEWYSRDESFWTGVVRLVAAHRMEVRADGLRLDKYWEPDLWAGLPFTQDEEYAEHYRDTFTDIVRRMSRSHRPVAFEVSGGLDSSSIFGMAETLRLRAELPARGIEAYTLDFRGDRDADEVDYARALGEHLAVRIHEEPPAYRPLQWYGEGARVSGEFPGYPNGTMSLHLRESARANGCRTLLAGEGGDEWLGAGSSGPLLRRRTGIRELASRRRVPEDRRAKPRNGRGGLEARALRARAASACSGETNRRPPSWPARQARVVADARTAGDTRGPEAHVPGSRPSAGAPAWPAQPGRCASRCVRRHRPRTGGTLHRPPRA